MTSPPQETCPERAPENSPHTHLESPGAARAMDGPVFLVGASRSGTAMMRSCLNMHARIHLATETHYFDDLRARKGIHGVEVLPAARHAECADYFRALDDRPYGMKGNPELSPFTRERLLHAAAGFGTDSDAIFEAYCRETARDKGAAVWGEKTPRHVFQIDAIRQRFPEARIICMLRDPRAVVASYRDWKNRGGLKRAIGNEDYQNAIRAEEQRAKLSYNLVIATMMWKAATNATLKARDRYGAEHVRVVNYEAVVADSEEQLRAICDWLGLPYDPAVLQIPMLNSSVSQFSDRAGISKEPAHRWREMLSDHEIDVVQRVAGPVLGAAGYERLDTRGSALAAAGEAIKLPGAVARAVFANRNRMGNLFGYTWRRLRAVASG